MTIKTAIGKITADKATLNRLSLLLEDAATLNEIKGHTHWSEDAKEAGEQIYNALEAAGVYDD